MPVNSIHAARILAMVSDSWKSLVGPFFASELSLNLFISENEVPISPADSSLTNIFLLTYEENTCY